MIGVLVVDDHAIFRSGLKRLFSDEADIRVEGEARSSAEALGKLRERHYDVVLLDISMEGRSGLDALASIRAEHPDLPVLMLSMYPEEQYAVIALKSGANGYASKDIEADDLTRAIREVARGGKYLTPRVSQAILAQMDGHDGRPLHQKLSSREYEILLLIVGGASLTEIGEKMLVSVKTVSTYRSRLLTKLGLSSNAELVRYALQHGILR
ncbi:Response regulator containing a CheY-like receiver domain and an HTH DNA-binding domain [Burkholderiales bacterium]|jgi:DNA-binding NarL/FixJ family response regulator|nr:Response regulator containing a CheY-like receiver domain and an HTH DNA-binding domain [Burkholderiales bacterium]